MRHALFALALLTGCAASTSNDIPENAAELVTPIAYDGQVKKTVEDLFKDRVDPMAEQYSDVVAVQAPGGAIGVCGYVNAKNRTGEYVGRHPFAVSLSPDHKVLSSDIASNEKSSREIRGACAEVGLNI